MNIERKKEKEGRKADKDNIDDPQQKQIQIKRERLRGRETISHTDSLRFVSFHF